jgi:hypothetical protein
MKYYKVKKGTKQWDCFNRFWTFEDKWMENKDKIDQLIGCPMEKNLRLATDALYLDNPPEHLESQFKKWHKDFGYEAKKNSQINKLWINLAKDLGLEVYRQFDFLGDLGLLFTDNKIDSFSPQMNNEYYFSVDENKKDKGHHRDKIDWSTIDWVEEVDEPTFLRIRADWLEQQKSA